MSKLTIDAGLVAQLTATGGTVELCDPSGKTLGRFVPACSTRDESFYRALAAESPYSPDELREAHAEAMQGKGRPLAEIWKDLGQ